MTFSFRRCAGAMLALATTYLAACTFGLDGLSGGTVSPDASAPDSSTALSDASTTDAMTLATTDAGASCPDHPDAIFCDLFDGSALQSVWATSVNGEGTVQLADGGLVSTVPVDSEKGLAEANIAANFPLPSGGVRTYVDLYIDSVSDRGSYIDTVTLDDGVHVYDLQLFDRSDGSKIETDEHLDDGGFASLSYPTTTVPVHDWVRVIIDVDYTAGATPAYSVSLADPPTAPAVLLLDRTPIDWPYTPTNVTITIGATDVNEPTAAPWRLLYDNVVVTPR